MGVVELLNIIKSSKLSNRMFNNSRVQTYCYSNDFTDLSFYIFFFKLFSFLLYNYFSL